MTEQRHTPTRPVPGDDPLSRRIREVSQSPGSSVRMCHEQGKTAIYLSDDGEHIVEHEPNGTIRKKRFEPARAT